MDKMKKSSDKIIFDTRWIGEHGIGRFSKEIYDEDFFQPINLKGNPVSIFDVVKLTIYLFFNRGFFFSPGFNVPLFFLKRTAMTIHDLNHIDLEDNSSFLKKVYYNLILKRACKKCAIIFTVSEFSKSRIVDWSGIDPDKVKVVYNGVSKAFHDKVLPFEPGYPYIFIVGNRKTHKNEDRALRAFAQANINQNVKLLFSGNPSEQLISTTEELNIIDRVVFLGKLTEEKLAQTYKGTICLLFPSLYEGFGLPAIEAMSCGKYVISSNSTALKEINLQKELLVNPNSTKEIKDKIEYLVNNLPEYQYFYFTPEMKKKYNWQTSCEIIKNKLREFVQ